MDVIIGGVYHRAMVRRLRLMAGLALAVGLGGSGTAQQPPGQPDQQATRPTDQQAPPGTPTFRAGINFVRVDTILTDRNGNPVSDLKQSEFEVFEDGKPQAIETFKLVSLDGGLADAAQTPPREIRTDADEELEASKDDVRMFGIFLDDYHVSRDAGLATRNQIARFVETELGPSDMVGVMYPLESVSSVRMTRNHDAVTGSIRLFVGRKYEYQPKNEYEERYAHYPAETVEQIRNQVSLSAIKGLITHMGTLRDGRKALILVSEGYTNMLPPQLRDPIADQPGLGNPSRYDPQAASRNPNEERAAMMASASLDSDLREVYGLANRNNTAIYAVDPRGLAASEFGLDKPSLGIRTDSTYLDATMQTLRVLADNSDGRAIVNRNDITVAMKQIVRDTSAYYLLGYTSSQAPSDGKFHEIRVRVKRPGVQVRTRKGYWAMNREETATATEPPKPKAASAVEHALTAATQTAPGRLIRTWIGTRRGENGRTRVTFVWEPSPKAPGAAARASEQPVRVALTAAGADGTPYFRGRVPDAASEAAPVPPASNGRGSAGSGARVSFEAQPGTMQLRVAVEGAGSEVLDSEIRDIVVPDLTTPQTSIGTPEIFRARTIREMQQLKGDQQALPTPAREFSRSERILVRVPAYGPGIQLPKMTARLLNRTGQPLSALPVIAAESAGAFSQVEVPLAGLAPGEYLIEIDASGEGGDARELVGFRVTG